MINILALDYVPQYAAWIHQAGEAISAVAIAGNADSPNIRIYDGKGSSTPLKILDNIHMKPLSCMTYNPMFDVVISADIGGMVEYWRGLKGYYDFPKNVAFESKIDTDLYEFAKHKTYALSMTVSNDGKFLATFGADKKIRVFRFLLGKLYCVIDESLNHYFNVQQSKQIMPAMEFNRKVSNEKELEKTDFLRHCNIVFDFTGHFIMYPTMIGIKLVNLYTNKNMLVIGRNENSRFVNLALCQNDESNATALPSMEMQASDNPCLNKDLLPDPTLICCAYKKNRLFLFTRRNGDHSSRDVFNEKPSHEDRISIMEEAVVPKIFESATMHTNVGDIHIKLFPRECPKTVENFCGLAKNNYYNGCIFHRVIKQFMVQTGDPTGIGTGGESLWGDEFEDEFHPKLKHDRPYTLSMANAGPNTNGSQFFISVVPASWLDNKHTVFGRVVKGMEVAQSISMVKTHPKTDKPYDDIVIVSVTVRDPIKL
jgi:peptidylprolyl isomerase domain and WD repeat-containing protein 1